MRAVGGERIRPADPSQRRPHIVDFLGVIGQPFVRGPASHVTFGALEKSVVVLGMAVCNPIARAILLELFDRVGAVLDSAFWLAFLGQRGSPSRCDGLAELTSSNPPAFTRAPIVNARSGAQGSPNSDGVPPIRGIFEQCS